ncbi:MAG: hypothetical protein JXK51_06590 [Halothiobacillaceae bacterium]|nr:hypothetical protein [Halothiobacillaceae bacterium]
MTDTPTFGADWHPAQIQGAVYALGFSAWKRASLRACFQSAQLKFINQLPMDAPAGAWLVVWGAFDGALIPENTASWRILRVEDGFLRSVGLGADLIQPTSWVVDPMGMYYDARTVSRLEYLLQTLPCTADRMARAARVHQSILQAGLTKYNVGTNTWQRPEGAQQVVLVIGQVETDASLKFGAPGIAKNMDLLRAVRAACGETAHLVYKPHPDVAAKLRAEGVGEGAAGLIADTVLVDGDMAALLAQVDEVHVMTSLAGFEALLRGIKVVTYGQPFYAGWGLTEDTLPHARRTRVLSLPELIAGVLIDYPLYFSAKQTQLVPVEEAITQLQQAKLNARRHPAWWRVFFRMILRRWVGVR